MKKKEIIATIALYLFILAIGFAIASSIYQFWFLWTHPHYTEMMLFQKFWMIDIVVVIALIGTHVLLKELSAQ